VRHKMTMYATLKDGTTVEYNETIPANQIVSYSGEDAYDVDLSGGVPALILKQPKTVTKEMLWDWRIPDNVRYIALDTETTLIENEQTPDFVLATIAYVDNNKVYKYIVTKKQLNNLIDKLYNNKMCVIMHNAAFDLAVIYKATNNHNVYKLVDNNKVYDTMLLYQLYKIAKDGNYYRANLAVAAKEMLDEDIEKEIDYNGKDVRTTFGDYINNVENLPLPYAEYCLSDADVTLRLANALHKAIYEHVNNIYNTREQILGIQDIAELHNRWNKYGMLTHNIQLKGIIALKDISTRGIRINVPQVRKMLAEVQIELDVVKEELNKYGYNKGKGSGQFLQDLLAEIEPIYYGDSGRTLLQTPSRKYDTSADAIKEQSLESYHPFFTSYARYKDLEKQSNELQGMIDNIDEQGRIHTYFNNCLVTGRTSSSRPNIQNVSKHEGFRECYIPTNGYCFVDIDYSAIELTTLAETCINVFNVPSKMAEYINDGKDLHKVMGSKLSGIPYENVDKDTRQKAKAVNFGFPGGLGAKKLVTYAKNNYNVSITQEQAQQFKDDWKETFPEMETFLQCGGSSIYEALQIHLINWKGEETSPMYAVGMVNKILSGNPISNSGNQYESAIINTVWEAVQAWANTTTAPLTDDEITAINNREGSQKLQMRLETLLVPKYCVTSTGRIRQTNNYNALHNTLFQGLAADGAKLAMYNLFRSGYRMVNFIHDEVLVEVPATANLNSVCDDIQNDWEEGMEQVIKDVTVSSEYTVSDVWSKKAELVKNAKDVIEIWKNSPN